MKKKQIAVSDPEKSFDLEIITRILMEMDSSIRKLTDAVRKQLKASKTK